MRLFIAVTLPQEIKDYLSTLQRNLPYKGLNKVKSMHLTLKFLGEVDDNKVDKIREKLSKVKFEKFTAKLDGAGVFPNENYVKVIWAGLNPGEKFKEIQQQIEDVLKDDFKHDEEFHPHITLARIKFLEDKKAFVNQIKTMKIEPREFEVSSFKLFKSELIQKKPVHTVLEEF